MALALFNHYRANRLHRQAQAHSHAGDVDTALALYEKCLALDPARSNTIYNIALIHKYRGDWERSFEFNAKAYALAPRDEACRWNLAIAATALRRWSVARSAWSDNGMNVPAGDGPIAMDFGVTPVRLNPEGGGEVVWGRRVDPVRVVIESIPFPESGFRLNDVVLHDGAGVGSRSFDGREYPVFNVLELFEPSTLSTYVLDLRASAGDQIEWLAQLAADTGVAFEDWTGNVRTLCKQCSEGTPHETHDHEAGWDVERRIGLACSLPSRIETLVEACKKSGRLEIVRVTMALAGQG